ncbi:hypothetical protein GCM10028857_03050 [Salinarchaeum chitinilyticum]
MISDIDFYELSEEKQRRLIQSDRVATTDRLLSELPEERVPLRVFENSLGKLALDLLETGQYSLAEIAEEFNVQIQDIREIIQAYRRRSKNDYKGRYTKFSLLQDRKGVIRVGKDDGRTAYYTLEKIPYFARLVDPTLCVSLLNIDKRLEKFPKLTERIPADKAAGIDEEYALVIGDFWGIDPQEVFDQITNYDRKYVETTLMPFPIVEATDDYESVESRFRQRDPTYNRFRIDQSSIENLGQHFVERASEQRVGIVAYQEVSIEFADLKWYAQIKEPSLLRPIDTWFENILQTLNPDIEPVLGSEIDRSNESDEQMDDNVSLDDRVLSALTTEPQSVGEVHQSLPPVVAATTEKDEVQAALTRLSDLGVTSEVTDAETTKYTSESGEVVVSSENRGYDL